MKQTNLLGFVGKGKEVQDVSSSEDYDQEENKMNKKHDQWSRVKNRQ